MMKIVHYLNQFFGQIGGEDKADIPPLIRHEPVGPAQAFAAQLKDIATASATVICGDNYMAENQDKAIETLLTFIRSEKPDMFMAGPAFNAGRYGPACGAICTAVAEELHIPVITGMYPENPGAEMYRHRVLIVQTGNSVAGMRPAIAAMCALARKLAAGEPLGPAAEDGYLPTGLRKNIWRSKTGASRAMDMLLAVIDGKDVPTELPMPIFDEVAPASPVADVSKARIALVTEGGLVQKGNPEGLESSRASKFFRLSLEGLQTLSPDAFQTVHGGYNNAFINEDPNRLVPLDVCRDLVSEGLIGGLAEYCFTTTGNGTSYQNSKNFGAAIASALRADNVQGVILTST
jgi:glycine reductase